MLNEGIRQKEVMVITDTGEKLGVVNTKVALNMAYDKDLDLVLVAPGAKPPVAKFMDFNKFKYEQSRRLREAKKNQKIQDNFEKAERRYQKEQKKYMRLKEKGKLSPFAEEKMLKKLEKLNTNLDKAKRKLKRS